jgi:hypothetical protein
MLRGTVKFDARIVDRDRGLTFPLFEFDPNKPAVEKVEIQARAMIKLSAWFICLRWLVPPEDGITTDAQA